MVMTQAHSGVDLHWPDALCYISVHWNQHYCDNKGKNKNLANALVNLIPTIQVANVNGDYFSVDDRNVKKPACLRQWLDRKIQVGLKYQLIACGCDPQPSFLDEP